MNQNTTALPHFLAYVNNIYDHQPKPLTPEILNQLIDADATQGALKQHREGSMKDAKNRLPGVMFNGLFSPSLAEAHMKQPLNAKGKAPSMRDDECFVTWPLMALDIDPKDGCALTPSEQFETTWNKVKEVFATDPEQLIAMAYASPSIPGWRIVVKRAKGLTIEQEQERWNAVLPIKCDAKCKNVGRVFYLTSREDMLYLNPAVLFANEAYNAEDYPAKDAHPVATCLHDAYKTSHPTPTMRQSEYNTETLENIVYELEQSLGGGSARKGDRNNQVFRMAAQLKSIVGPNIPLLQSVIPTYDLSPAEHLQAITNGLKAAESANLPQTLERAISRVASGNKCTANATPPPMPEVLPPAIAALVSIVPEKTRAAAALSSFAAWRAHMKGVSFQYIDNLNYVPAFFSICCAEQGEGKTAIRIGADCILESIKDADARNRILEEEWREECRKLSANKDKPQAPQLPIRIVEPNMTNPAFVWRAFKAEGYPLYTYAEELEKLDRLSGLSEIIRCAYDGARYGQERVSPGAVCLVVDHLSWNFNVATTPQTLRKKFKNDVLNGTLTRLSLSTIPTDENDFGDKMPIYGKCDEAYKAQLKPYIERLTQATGVIDCPEAKAWAESERLRQIDALRAMDAHYLLAYMKRSLQMGFWRAMMLYIMNGCVWSKDIETFASWSIDYDLWCKVYFFADLIQNSLGDAPDNARYTKRLTTYLPNEFTRDDARNMRQDLGRSTSARDVSNMLSQWVFRGFVTYDEKRQVYIKNHFQKQSA